MSNDGKTREERDASPDDPIDRPSHYTSGGIEVWDFIRDQRLNYHRGCAVKYIARAGKKAPLTEVQDLQKAVAYLTNEIENLKKRSDSPFPIGA